MLAEYDVNIASVARNVVIMMNLPEVVGITKCVPCWQTAPQTNDTISNGDILRRSIGCMNCENIITIINGMITEQHIHTSTSCKKRKQQTIQEIFV